MSRLDVKRRKQQEQNGELPRSGKVGLIVFFSILALIVIAVVVLNQNYDFLSGITDEKDQQIELGQNTIASLSYSSDVTAGFVRYQDSILSYGKDGVRALSAAGQTEWEVPLSLNNPFVSVAGSYILIADKGGKQVHILHRDKVVLTSKTQYSILSASAAENGDFVTVTDEPYYKGLVTVKNLRDEEKFVWHSGTGYVVDAALSQDGKQLAATTMVVQGKIEASVLFFTLTESEPFQTHSYSGVVINHLEYNQDHSVLAVSDSGLLGFSARGEKAWEYDFGGRLIEKIAHEKDGTSAVAFSSGEQGQPQICVIDGSGRQTASIRPQAKAHYLSMCGGKIAYNRGRNIVVCNLEGEELYSIAANRDLRELVLFAGGTRGAGIGSASFDVIEVK